MKKDNKSVISDKILFPNFLVTKISTRLFTLIFAVTILGLLNTLPGFITNKSFNITGSPMQIIGNILFVLLFTFLIGAIDTAIFCIPILSFSSSLVDDKIQNKSFNYLIILMKIYFLTHLPLKFVEYSQGIIQSYGNFGLAFLYSKGFLLSIQILLSAWFSMSMARSIRKILLLDAKYEISVVLAVFGWFNLVSLVISTIMEYTFKFFM